MNIRTTPTHGLTSRRGESSHASEDAAPSQRVQADDRLGVTDSEESTSTAGDVERARGAGMCAAAAVPSVRSCRT